MNPFQSLLFLQEMVRILQRQMEPRDPHGEEEKKMEEEYHVHEVEEEQNLHEEEVEEEQNMHEEEDDEEEQNMHEEEDDEEEEEEEDDMPPLVEISIQSSWFPHLNHPSIQSLLYSHPMVTDIFEIMEEWNHMSSHHAEELDDMKEAIRISFDMWMHPNDEEEKEEDDEEDDLDPSSPEAIAHIGRMISPETRNESPMCAVCWEAPEATYMETVCRHTFHTECLFPWLKRRSNCPVCRHEFTRSSGTS